MAIRALVIIAVLMIAGCASQSGVMPDGPNAYRVIVSGKSGFVSTGKLKISAYQQATRFCASNGKRAETIADNSVENGFLRFPTADIRFQCVN